MSDYMFMLESHLDAGQSRAVAEVQRIATQSGMTVWLAGGAMRDMLRGAPVRDLDFTVERDAINTGRSLAQALGGHVVAEDPLKRWVELWVNGVTASVANARVERHSKPGGKPHIAPATIHEDLARRDFTINAIALSLNRGSRGLLVDPSNGQADLINRELRSTNPNVFFDDPIRIFRLIRLQHLLGFQVTPRTRSQLENALSSNFQTVASPAALAREIRATAMAPNAVSMLRALDEHGLLRLISPALTGPNLNTSGLARFEKLAHSVFLPADGGGWLAFLNVLVEKLSPKERGEAIRAFQLTAEEETTWKKLDAQAKKLETALKSTGIRKPSQVWNALYEVSPDLVLLVLYRSTTRVVQDRIRAFCEKYLPQSQEITDESVAATGAAPGTPAFHRKRRELVSARLNARPRKVVEQEPPAVTVATAAVGGRGQTHLRYNSARARAPH